MPEEALRLVLVFDAQSQSFKPSAHNLPADQAASYADNLHAEDGGGTRIVEQKTRHKITIAEGCNPCKKAAGKASTQPKSSSEPRQPKPESEGETSV